MALLLQNGDKLLLQSGTDKLLLQNDITPVTGTSAVTLGAATSVATGNVPIGTLDFNAAADRLYQTTVPTNITAFSCMLWVRRKSGNASAAFFLELDGAFTAALGSNNQYITFWNAGGGYTRPFGDGPLMTVDKWYCIGFKALTATTGTLYWGSETDAMALIGSAGTALGLTLGTFLRTTIGGSTYGSDIATADMGRVRFWNALLSDAEFETERQSVDNPVRTSNLSADWKLATPATKLVDSSGNSKTLTAQGAGPWSGVASGPVVVLPNTGSSVATLGATTSAASGYYGVVDPVGTSAVTLGAVQSVAAGNAQQPPLNFRTLMPRVSQGKPIFGTGSISQLFDSKYGYYDSAPGAGAWGCSNGSWGAINLGAGLGQILIALSADNIGSWASCNAFTAYRIQVSNDSTIGSDGTWTTAVTVTGNTYQSRTHKFDLAGNTWVKLIVDTTTGGMIDEMDIWDASAGTPDTFAFLGDSLSDGVAHRFFYSGGGQLPSLQENVQTNQVGHYPLQQNLGAGGEGPAYWVTNIGAALALYPDTKYWLVNIGMNSGSSMPAQIETFKTDLTTFLNAITAAGRIPILCRVSYTGAAGYGGGDYDTCGLRYLNDNGVNVVRNNLGLRAGPDLYQLFYDNRVAYNVTADPHPNETGYKAMALAWANSFGTDTLTRYGAGVTGKSLGATTSAASGTVTSTITGTSAVTMGAVTSAATGARGAAGTSAANTGATTSAASGSTVRGTAASTLGAATSVATGARGAAGTSAASTAATTSAATGSTVTGTSVRTTGATTSSAAGTHGVAGTSGVSTSPATSAGAGSTVTGTSAVTLGATACVATGNASSSTVSGASVVQLSAVASVAEGSTATGASTQTLGATTSAATGARGAAGTAASSLAATTSVATGSTVRGSIAVTLGSVTSAGAGTHTTTGSSVASSGATTSNASAAHGVAGSSVAALSAVTSAGSGSTVRGTSAVTTGATTCVATGSATAAGQVTGSSTVTFSNSTSAASGSTVAGSSVASSANTTSVATGARGAAGTSVSTSQATTSTASGSTVRGTSAVTTGATTSSMVGARGAAGTSISTTGATTSTGSGARGAQGSASSSTGATVSTGAGSYTTSGSSAVNLLDGVILGSGSSVAGSTSASTGATTSTGVAAHGVSGSSITSTGSVTSTGYAAQGQGTVVCVSVLTLGAVTTTIGRGGDPSYVDPFDIRGWYYELTGAVDFNVEQDKITLALEEGTLSEIECKLRG